MVLCTISIEAKESAEDMVKLFEKIQQVCKSIKVKRIHIRVD